MNVGTIQGGSATNVVPETCIVTGEVRSFHNEVHCESSMKSKKPAKKPRSLQVPLLILRQKPFVWLTG